MISALNRLVDLVEENLTGEFDVTGAARALGTTEHHLRRMFSSLAGMPLSEYVRRRRMTVAAGDVVRGEEDTQAGRYRRSRCQEAARVKNTLWTSRLGSGHAAVFGHGPVHGRDGTEDVEHATLPKVQSGLADCANGAAAGSCTSDSLARRSPGPTLSWR